MADSSTGRSRLTARVKSHVTIRMAALLIISLGPLSVSCGKRETETETGSSFEFSDVDLDGNGCVEGPEEMQKFRLSVGRILGNTLKLGNVESALRAGRITHSADVSGDGRICECDLLSILLKESTRPGFHRHAFRVFDDGSFFDDVDADDDGFLNDVTEKEAMTQKLAQCVPVSKAREIVNAMSRLEKDDGKLARTEYVMFLQAPPKYKPSPPFSPSMPQPNSLAQNIPQRFHQPQFMAQNHHPNIPPMPQHLAPNRPQQISQYMAENDLRGMPNPMVAPNRHENAPQFLGHNPSENMHTPISQNQHQNNIPQFQTPNHPHKIPQIQGQDFPHKMPQFRAQFRPEQFQTLTQYHLQQMPRPSAQNRPQHMPQSSDPDHSQKMTKPQASNRHQKVPQHLAPNRLQLSPQPQQLAQNRLEQKTGRLPSQPQSFAQSLDQKPVLSSAAQITMPSGPQSSSVENHAGNNVIKEAEEDTISGSSSPGLDASLPGNHVPPQSAEVPWKATPLQIRPASLELPRNKLQHFHVMSPLKQVHNSASDPGQLNKPVQIVQSEPAQPANPPSQAKSKNTQSVHSTSSLGQLSKAGSSSTHPRSYNSASQQVLQDSQRMEDAYPRYEQDARLSLNKTNPSAGNSVQGHSSQLKDEGVHSQQSSDSKFQQNQPERKVKQKLQSVN